MSPEEFHASLNQATPPTGLTTPAEALWHAAKGEWDTAHELAQSDKSSEGAWVHAHLHRIEGDLSNANYWYVRAGKPEHKGALEDERQEIAAGLL